MSKFLVAFALASTATVQGGQNIEPVVKLPVMSSKASQNDGQNSEKLDAKQQCRDTCKLEADSLCHGDAYKVIKKDFTIEECCAACAADSKCVQWGRFYAPMGVSTCYLSSTKTTSESKWGSTCGRKSSGSIQSSETMSTYEFTGSAEPQFVQVGWHNNQCPQGYSAITDVSTCIAAANFVKPQTGAFRDCWGKSWKDCLNGNPGNYAYSEVHPRGCSFESCEQMGADVLAFNPNPNPKHVGKDKESCGYDSLCQKTSTPQDTVAINPQEEKHSLRNMTALIGSSSDNATTWVSKMTLPAGEGTEITLASHGGTIQIAKDSCEGASHCVGFAYNSDSNSFFFQVDLLKDQGKKVVWRKDANMWQYYCIQDYCIQDPVQAPGEGREITLASQATNRPNVVV